MNLSRIFIERPVAIALAGTLALASLPGGSPDIMANERSPEAA